MDGSLYGGHRVRLGIPFLRGEDDHSPHERFEIMDYDKVTRLWLGGNKHLTSYLGKLCSVFLLVSFLKNLLALAQMRQFLLFPLQ